MKKDWEFISQSLPFSRKEVEDLAQKLVEVPHLSGPERALLVAVFAAAGDHVTVPGKPPEPTSKNLAEQILHVFVPDVSKEYVITSRIGTDPIIHPTPPGS